MTTPAPIVILDARGRYAKSGLSVSRNSTKYVFNPAGVLVPVSANIAPWDCDPLTGAERGLLVEEQRTNLLLRAAEFDNASWPGANITVTANAALGPDGTLTADKLAKTASGSGYKGQALLFSAATYAYSVWAKASTLGNEVALLLQPSYADRVAAVFNLATGTVRGAQAPGGSGSVVVGSSVESGGGGWYRCTLVATTAAGSGYVYVGPTDGAQAVTDPFGGSILADCYLWGAQVATGALQTSPILTTSATATRLADVVTLALGSWFNTAEGSRILRGRTAKGSGTQVFGQIDDGSESNRVRIVRDSSNVMRCIVTVAGVEVANLNLGTVANDTAFAVGFSWAANSFTATLNGGTEVTDTSGAVPSGLTTWRVGASFTGEHANGHILRDVYYPRALAAAVLKQRTK